MIQIGVFQYEMVAKARSFCVNNKCSLRHCFSKKYRWYSLISRDPAGASVTVLSVLSLFNKKREFLT